MDFTMIDSAITCAFWLALACILYTFMGYPFALWLFSKVSPQVVLKTPISPTVSIVIAVRNEETNIARRLDNLRLQDYPSAKIEVIVVSDGSTDDTAAIVSSYSGRNVRQVELGSRLGKALALNRGIDIAKGEVIVFADARQQFESSAVSELVANFNDPRIGCVSGELILVKDDQSLIQAEMGTYWNYEKWIRKMESQTGSVIGATGAIYAIRRSLYLPLLDDTILDDVLTPLNIIRQGYRCIFDSRAVAFDSFSIDAGQEWRRKVRTLAGNWQLLSLKPSLLLPWRNPCWWRFISHKIMRLIVPFALIILLLSGAFLPGLFYLAATAMQCFLYATALAGVFVPVLRRVRIVSPCYFFLVMNAAALTGFGIWLTGKSKVIWHNKVTA